MSDETSVMWSVGFLEGWIERSSLDDSGVLRVGSDADAALAHLKILEDAYKESCRNKISTQIAVQKVRENLDALI
jgi:hypothetical protein